MFHITYVSEGESRLIETRSIATALETAEALATSLETAVKIHAAFAFAEYAAGELVFAYV